MSGFHRTNVSTALDGVLPDQIVELAGESVGIASAMTETLSTEAAALRAVGVQARPTDYGPGMPDTPHTRHFNSHLEEVDSEVFAALEAETQRQRGGIELIASENLVSQATLDALGSPIVNKTVEGYPGSRYYGGAEHADSIENLAIERAKQLFGAEFANVQSHSGSQANLAVFLAFLNPGDTVLSMDLSAGGHLSHGAAPNISGSGCRSSSTAWTAMAFSTTRLWRKPLRTSLPS